MKRPSCPECGSRMWKIGKRAGRQRWRCSAGCLDTVHPDKPRRRPSTRLRLAHNGKRWQAVYGEQGYPLSQDDRGRWRVQLGNHRHANSGGWQYLSRFIVADALDQILRPDEHVHHCHQDHRKLSANLDLSRLELVLAEYHGRVHATHTTLATPSQLSQHLSAETPWGTRQVRRWRAIIGPAAADEPTEPH